MDFQATTGIQENLRWIFRFSNPSVCYAFYVQLMFFMLNLTRTRSIVFLLFLLYWSAMFPFVK